MNKGFTLIEIVIYLALFLVLVTSMVLSSIELLSSSENTRTEVEFAREELKIISKIQWIFNSNVDVLAPLLDSSDNILLVQKGSQTIELKHLDSSLFMRINAEDWSKINSDWSEIADFNVGFRNNQILKEVVIMFAVNGRHATSTHYLLP